MVVSKNQGIAQIPPSLPLPGETLAGKFRIERILGAGGMGIVFAARHIALDERVAIKFLIEQEGEESAGTRSRFLREARAAIRIRSEHVVRVLDVGQLDDGRPYTVFEYLEGEDLAERTRVAPMLLTAAVDAIVQACAAIAEAHALGIVHRDIKPSNLFLATRADGSPCVKVLDFGIAKVEEVTGNTKGMLGSPLFMAPEQFAAARNVDLRCDVWGLGATLYALLTNREPFDGETIAELYGNVLNSATPRVSEIVATTPSEIDAIIGRCLAKKREDRYANATELALALMPFASNEVAPLAQRMARASNPDLRSMAAAANQTPRPMGSPPMLLEHASTIASDGKTPFEEPQPRSPSPATRRTGLALIVAAGCLVIVAIVAMQRRPTPTPTPATTTTTTTTTPTPTPTVTVTALESAVASVEIAPPPPPPPPPLPSHTPAPTLTAKPKPALSAMPTASAQAVTADPSRDLFRRH